MASKGGNVAATGGRLLRGLGILGAAATFSASAQTSDPALNALVKKGFLTVPEAQAAWAEAQSNTVNQAASSASRWHLSQAVKDLQLFGDFRFRYEYRAAANAPGSGAAGDLYARERFRYAARVGIRGDLFDSLYYGFRLDTSTNPRSPWVTFGDDSAPTPFGKASDGLSIGQIYVGWRPTDWYEMIVGKMPMSLVVTPLLWDADLNPEGAFERLKTTVGRADLFAQFGQFLYQDTNPDRDSLSADTFLLAWQVGASVHVNTNVSVRLAPVVYTYTGKGSGGGLEQPYTGEGFEGLNGRPGAAYNQVGINDLLVLETPVEVNFRLAGLNARVFADFAYNLRGDSRARAAAGAASLAQPVLGDDKAYLAGVAIGNLGLVYGQTARRNTWEARVYWQHVEQYAADVNLLDSDFLEGRANLEGIYSAFAYSLTDCLLGTVRFGYGQRINDRLGTGGNNPDLPLLNPVRDYRLLQLDLTYRF